MSEWYALCAAPRRETVVAAGLAERGFTFFLPMQTDHRAGKIHMEPLFPGFVFVLCELADLAEQRALDGVDGLFRYTRNDGMLWPVEFPGRVILGLQIEERSGTYDFTKDRKPPPYKPSKGDTVRITAGDYYGFLATVLRAKQGDRYELLIQHEAFTSPRKRTEDVAHLAAA
jgi:transcription antitermination factor NusG